ncbi:MAG: hypothetical protein K2Q34_03510 [Alphaproteobacteria bacterium]|nr:hypothetical protein [Alphaproteobacteria bacterium]
MVKALASLFLSSTFLFSIEAFADLPQPVATVSPSLPQPVPMAASKMPQPTSTGTISPDQLDFRLYMNTDANHEKMEELVPSLPITVIESARRDNVYALITPLMHLDLERIKELFRGKIVHVEGPFTFGDLEVVSGKDHLAFLHADIDGKSLAEKRTGGTGTEEYQFFTSNQPLLLEHGTWNSAHTAFDFTYRWPGDNQIHKTVVLRLSNIFIKNASTPTGQYLESIIRYPTGVMTAQPVQRVKKRKRHHHTDTVIIQQVPAPTPPPGPTFITPQPQTVYVAPPPAVVYGPPVVGGVIIEERFRGRRHWR